MPLRQIIRIDETLCDGCGACVTACAEGAIEVVDGTARLIREDYCDGLGACLGDCPRGAITLEAADAAPFDEEAVRRHLGGGAPQGLPTLAPAPAPHGGCPGSAARLLPDPGTVADGGGSALRHWPVQLHLIAPGAPAYRNADLLVAADCSAFAAGDFHRRFLAGSSVVIACPKLDQGMETYAAKLEALLAPGAARSVTVVVMEVPCCGGLLRLVQQAAQRAGWQRPISVAVVGVDGTVRHEAEIPPAVAAS